MQAIRLLVSPVAGLFLCHAVSAFSGETSFVHLANPLQGTDSTREFSHGNTYPAVAGVDCGRDEKFAALLYRSAHGIRLRGVLRGSGASGAAFA